MILYYSTTLLQTFAIISKSYNMIAACKVYYKNNFNSRLCDPNKLKTA